MWSRRWTHGIRSKTAADAAQSRKTVSLKVERPQLTLLKEKKYRYTAYPTQKEALESVRAKKADATVIDIIMAAYYTGDGQEYDDLGFDISLNDEMICVGFCKDSDLVEKVNEFLKTSYEDGTVNLLASRYGIESAG